MGTTNTHGVILGRDKGKMDRLGNHQGLGQSIFVKTPLKPDIFRTRNMYLPTRHSPNPGCFSIDDPHREPPVGCTESDDDSQGRAR